MIVPKQNIDTFSEAVTVLIQNRDPSERLAGAIASSSHGDALADKRTSVIAKK